MAARAGATGRHAGWARPSSVPSWWRVVVSIATGSAQAFAHYGLGFVWSGTYSPSYSQYGAGLLIVGTVRDHRRRHHHRRARSGSARRSPCPNWCRARSPAPASTLIELLAAVPSIVVGLWALLVLSPLSPGTWSPSCTRCPCSALLFGGVAYGPSIILAAVVLAMMTLPTLVSLSRTALRAVPVADREAAMALGRHPLAGRPEGRLAGGSPGHRRGQ